MNDNAADCCLFPCQIGNCQTFLPMKLKVAVTMRWCFALDEADFCDVDVDLNFDPDLGYFRSDETPFPENQCEGPNMEAFFAGGTSVSIQIDRFDCHYFDFTYRFKDNGVPYVERSFPDSDISGNWNPPSCDPLEYVTQCNDSEFPECIIDFVLTPG